MNYGGLQYSLTTKSLEIYLSGCEAPYCAYCHNPELHDFKAGKPISNEMLRRVASNIKYGEVEQIWVLGGEPLDQKPLPLRLLLRSLSQYKLPIIVFTKYEQFEIDQMPKHLETLKEFATYIKLGRYVFSEASDNSYSVQGIRLASRNQTVIPASQLWAGGEASVD